MRPEATPTRPWSVPNQEVLCFSFDPDFAERVGCQELLFTGVDLMRKTIWTGLAACLLVAVSMFPPLSRPLLAEDSKAAAAQSMPKVGDMAPDFKLQYFDGTDLKNVTLSQYRGQKSVIVAFYVFAFTGG